MNIENIDICQKIRENSPLIHCITNPISMMQCANAVLGLGARPVMAEHPKEVAQITETARALLLNFGNISDSRMEAMEISYQKAQKLRIPIVIDMVGISCSDLRREFVRALLGKRAEASGILILKGNYSEIAALYDTGYRSEGVDAKRDITLDKALEMSATLAKSYNCIILASGKTDVVTDGKKSYLIKNGTPRLSTITGTGCMLGAIAATFCSCIHSTGDGGTIEGLTTVESTIKPAAEVPIEHSIDSTVAAALSCASLGIAGEKADNGHIGSGSFLISLLDEISFMSDETLLRSANIEEIRHWRSV